MTEQRFIHLNKDKWREFEKVLHADSKSDPDRLSELYVHLMDDLSYARTHFPKSKLTHYLNQLTVGIHKKIYGVKRERKSRFISLYSREIPEVFYRNRRFMVYSLIIFCTSVLFGMLSSLLEPEFVRTILGDGYVNMTLDNIESGDPMAVYKSMDADGMFVRIAINNIRVAFVMYILGIFAGIPTILLLLFNGVMVGAFLQFFISKGLGSIALSTIFLHGAMELSAIVIAGACGLLLGSSVLFPGTYPRMYALLRGAKDSLKIALGVTPFIVAAAIIESYVTRLYLDMSGATRLTIILSSFAVMFWYVIVYPRKFSSK